MRLLHGCPWAAIRAAPEATRRWPFELSLEVTCGDGVDSVHFGEAFPSKPPLTAQYVCYRPSIDRQRARQWRSLRRVKGGVKLYHGAGKDARQYVEADHQRADDYYLAEGSGIAEVVAIDADGDIVDRMQLDGDTYEAWVEGVDVRTGELKGNVRRGAEAEERPPLRFAEVIVNGPKSWSIAAALHEDVAAACDRAQDEAVQQIGAYVAQQASTRVGSRGAQVQMPAARVEMARIRHFTTRAGDPHRHIHLQVNARILAADGKWRGIDSVPLLRMQRAINGVGHRAVAANPEFRAALSAHGYTLDESGEIRELAQVVPAMSKRSEQIARNLRRYEAQWRAENPGGEPDRKLLRAWVQRAWEDGREKKKLTVSDGSAWEDGWRAELRDLGVDPAAEQARSAVDHQAMAVGSADRDRMARRVQAVLGAGARGRSTWNVFDIRGVAEEVITAHDIAGDRAAIDDLAEDLAERVHTASVNVLDAEREAPAHVRQWTSHEVIALDRELDERMALRSTQGHTPAPVEEVAAAESALASKTPLDTGQVEAVRAIAGTGQLVIVEGAAGAGKTTTLAAAETMLAAQGRRMVVVAPTKKAAFVAASEIDSDTDTAHALAFQHGYRWDSEGVWSRLHAGDVDASTGREYRGPRVSAVLSDRDVVVIDEAGMIDQQTARALLTIADEAGARVVFVGDRRQLPAVGIGGALDKAARWAPAQATIAEVHRFRVRPEQDGAALAPTRDSEFAELSLRIRSGVDPGAVFDELLARGEIRLHRTEADAVAAIAYSVAERQLAGVSQSIAVPTNEAAAVINEVARERLVSAGRVDDAVTVHGSDGLRVGVGDQVMTRQNDPGLGVANREVWTVTQISADGGIALAPASRPPAGVPARTPSLPAEYVREHVHLAYASTVHGVQGETTDASEALAAAASDAPSVYVALTRGRYERTLHMVGDTATAREEYVEIAGRSRADLGLDQARRAAQGEASQYRSTDVPDFLRPTRPSLAERLAKVQSGVSPAGIAAAAVGQLGHHQEDDDVDALVDDELSPDTDDETWHDRPDGPRYGPRL